MPTPETSIRLQKASEGSSTSVSEALSRLKEHLPVLRRRFWLLSGFSLLGFFFASAVCRVDSDRRACTRPIGLA